MAIGSDADAVVLLTLDNCGMTTEIRNEVARRLKEKAGLPPERVAICVSHTHCGPVLANSLAGMFAEPLPPEHKQRVDQYTSELIDHLEQVALSAIADRQPGHLAWTQGTVGFANNRRAMKNGQWAGFGVEAAGPVDHALPMLRVTSPDGKLRGVLANYACHCTTLGGSYNKINGDWAGYAQEIFQREHPGVTALIAIGCGADANPQPREQLSYAVQHGQQVADEIKRLLSSDVRPVSGRIRCQLRHVELPFGPLPSRADWEAAAKGTGPEAYRAQLQLARLERGEAIATKLPYTIGTWEFGDDLVMVFLAGEVVVDYSLRLKKELDGRRVWVNAYANDVPCYIASKRVIEEGGYEVDRSMCYYDQPTRLAPECEEIIVRTVHEMLPGWRDQLTPP
jgi:hypothetical protein